MRVAIDAVAVARGGRAILDALIDELDARGAHVTVFDTTPASGRLGLMRWALREWREHAAGFDRSLTFTGLGAAPGQVCLVHNALYYEPASRMLSRSAQLRLAVLRELTGHAVSMARHVVVQSPTMANHVAIAHGVAATQIMTIPPAPTIAVPIAGDLLWVGNELAFKDFETAIQAANALKRSLTLIGNTVAMAPGPWHRWVGDVPRAQVFAHYAGARWMVATSRAESLGLPLAEAMQTGLAVVAPDLPWAKAVCGEAAHYYPPGDIAALVRTIGTADSNDVWYKERARARVETWKRNAPMARFADLILS